MATFAHHESLFKAPQNVSEGVIVCDDHMRIKDMNQAAETILGCSLRLVVGKKFCAVAHCRSVSGVRLDSQRCGCKETVLKKGSNYRVDTVFAGVGNKTHPVDLLYTPLRNHGKIAGVLVSVRNVSERGHTLQNLVTHENYYKALSELGQFALAEVGLQTLFDEAVRTVPLILGTEYCKILELLPDGKRFLLRAGTGWKEGLVGKITVANEPELLSGYTLASRQPVTVVEDRRSETRFENSPLLEDHQVLSSISAVIGSIDAPYGVLGVHTASQRVFDEADIKFITGVANLLALAVQRDLHKDDAQYSYKALTKANEELRSEIAVRERKSLMLDGVLQELESQRFALDQHSIVAITDAAGKITYVNDKFCEISKYSREELIGQNHRILKSGFHPPEFFKHMWRTIAHGEVWKGEVKNRNKLAEFYWVDTTIVPFLNEKGKPYQYVAIRTDITQRKRDESDLAQARDAALEASRLKSEFLATMSHEIRTPMNGVLGMVELLLDSPLEAYQREFAKTILDSSTALLGIINDILDFSKIEAGRMILEDQDFSLQGVVESVADILALSARQKGLALMTYVDINVPSMLRGDSGRLRQILLNLVGNAVKFTPQGEVLVNVSMEKMFDSSVNLRFEISDTGIGMSATGMNQLFQPFIQADGSATRKYGGTGLGLSISKRLVELMGSDIHVRSIEGEGSTFWFVLPFKHAQSGSQPAAAAVDNLLHGARVLVVDDSQANCDIMQHYLAGWGANCVSAESAAKGLMLLKQAALGGQPFDMALIDLAMPHMDGYEMGAQINHDPLLANTKLVMMTATDEVGQSDKVLHAGFKAYFNKPVRRDQIFDGLCRVMRGDVQVMDRSASYFVGRHRQAEPMELPQPAVTGAVTDGRIVLLVEDNLVNQNVAKRQLERLGYAVCIAGNGVEAVDAFQKNNFSLVLMDCQMPEMDGFEATVEIRKFELEHGRTHTPVIAMTANAVQGDRESCLKSGMDDYLPKPVRMDTLQEMLSRWDAASAFVQPESVKKHVEEPEAGVPLTFDPKMLESLRCEIGEDVNEIVSSYLASTPALLEKLVRAYEVGDSEQQRMFVHSLKSSSLQLGLCNLGAMAQSLELRIRQGDTGFGIEEIEPLFEEFHRAKQVLGDLPITGHLPKAVKYARQAVVMVVDDDVTMRMMLKAAMKNAGYHVVEAVNGEQAISVYQAERPDIVLMDCIMPVMDGFEACKQLLKLPSEAHAPVLMITGLNDESSAQQAMQCGAADFITKPVYLPILTQRVKHLLEVRQAHEHIHHLAYHDTLTGLPNRMLFHDRLHLAIAGASRGGYRLAIMFLDLDHFKKVNDSLGHAVGDLLLRAVAERISYILREGDTLSRMGGDEFTILLQQLAIGDDGIQHVQMIAGKIIESIKAPFLLDGHEVYVGASIGVSLYPDDSEDEISLLKYADSAMYSAKSAGRNGFCFYSSSMNAEVSERLQLENDLRKAIERNELLVYYQPQWNAITQQIEGAEALVRWRHPELGLVSPATFIPLAEETGLIIEIGTWVLETACRQCKQWHDLGYERMSVAVNLSAYQFRSGNLIAQVQQSLERSGLTVQALDLEITESVTMHGSEMVHATLSALKGLGVVISMDDFGTGFSSLSYLKRFPIDVLKIDQSFVRDIVDDPNDAAIVETIIAMAKVLELEVIAEGVETEEQLAFLRNHGCHTIQGYLISRPLPADEINKLLAT